MSAVSIVQAEEKDPFVATRQEFELLERFLRSPEGHELNHSDMERELAQRGQELMRKLYQAWLDDLGPGKVEGPVRDAAGQQRGRERVHDRNLETVFGTVKVERRGYGAEGEASLHPLDGHLNLPDELYSHELRRRAAEESSKNSFDETVHTLNRHTGAEIGKRQVEELVVRAAQDFDSFYETRQHSVAPETTTGSVLVITSDGKGVVMHKEDLRPATRKAAEKEERKLGTRLAKEEKRNRKRMATVAAVYTVDPFVRTPEQAFRAVARQSEDPEEHQPARPRPERKRVWASLEKKPLEVLEQAFQEALHRDPSGEKAWAGLVDGNEHQLDVLEHLADKHEVRLTIVVDLFHVLGYVWKAGRALEGEDAEKWVLERLMRILEGRSAHVAAGMRRSATLRGLSCTERAPVDDCADYLLKYQSYLAYDEYLAAGLPICTGVIEGACRHLVKDRLEITGAQWRLARAEAILRLRALRSSEDFDEYWKFHERREYERNHCAGYADGDVPPVISTESGGLRLVK